MAAPISISSCVLMHRDSENTVQYSFSRIQIFSTTQKMTMPKHKFFFVNQETKSKLFLAVTVEFNTEFHWFQYSYAIFYKNSFLVAEKVCELSWHKFFFSNVNWGQLFNQCTTSTPHENMKNRCFLMFSGGIEAEHWLKWV